MPQRSIETGGGTYGFRKSVYGMKKNWFRESGIPARTDRYVRAGGIGSRWLSGRECLFCESFQKSMYNYLKSLHIIFIVTWFAGMFYIVRLYIYNTEANLKQEPERSILQKQFSIMIKRLWFGITWPSAVLTLILGTWVMLQGQWDKLLFDDAGRWLLVKLCFVVLLYVYHFTLHGIYKQQSLQIFRYSSQQLRIWNEVATIFLVAIVMLATVKQTMSWVWGLIGLIGFIIVLMSAIKIYKQLRND
jgi:putative membrane protein